ncbi:MAG: hypothetical protein AAFZ18_38675 [Myxococcota bacterium]
MRWSGPFVSLALLFSLSACQDQYVCTCRVTCDGTLRLVDAVVCADDDDIQDAVDICQARQENQCTEASCACICDETAAECVDV